MIRLTDLAPADIAAELGLKPFQGKQIFQWLYGKGVYDFDDMTNLSKSLRQRLTEQCVAAQLALVHVSESPDTGTRKALFRLPDGETVESVLLRSGDRITLCLSTQVGCALNCTFCATGKSGFTRNLSPGEIAEQAVLLLAGEELEGRTPNVVYMGMGEPFENYDNVAASIRLLMHPEGMNIGARKVTVSTVGIVPGIERFAREGWQVRLSISLHGANDALRDRLLPINKRYPLDDLLDAVRRYIQDTGRQVTFEWVLLDGENDSPGDARQLAALIRGMKASVNLIPYNPVAESPYQAPPQERCQAFQGELAKAGIRATLRKELGRDIEGACGQLRRRYGRD